MNAPNGNVAGGPSDRGALGLSKRLIPPAAGQRRDQPFRPALPPAPGGGRSQTSPGPEPVNGRARHTLLRNPGPSWGYGFLLWAERWWPRWFFRPVLLAGTGVALAFMPVQRQHSHAYLAVVLGRPATFIEVWRHFFAVAESLVFSLRASRGVPVRCVLDPEHEAAFEGLIHSGRPALFGSFHFGGSDLLGYLLSDRGRRVTILRLQVRNSTDTRLLGQRFSRHVSFLWINDPARMIFDLKAALEAGESLAMKCDRLEFSARSEPFRFLGATRLFPFTIYQLALLFDRPVVFCIAVQETAGDRLRVHASPVFMPDPTVDRAANTRVARAHFQAVLDQLEILVRAHPFLWFNFIPLNPEAAGENQPPPAPFDPRKALSPSNGLRATPLEGGARQGGVGNQCPQAAESSD